MSAEQPSQAADAQDCGVVAARVAAEPPSTGAAAGSHWPRMLVAGVAIVAAALGLYCGGQALLREPEAPPADLAARLPPEPVDQKTEKRGAALAPPKRLPLDPLVPKSGAHLIAEAERVARDLVERFPENPDAYEMRARFHFEFADLDTAAGAWQRCLQLNANYAYAHAGLAKIAAERGDLAQAVAHWRRTILVDPGNVSHQIELGKALLAAGDVDESILVLERAVQAAPGSAAAHAELGSARLQKREDSAAKAAFEKALALDPRLAPAHFGMATACARLHELELAQHHQTQYAELRSDRTQEVRRARRAYDDDRALGADIARLYTDMGSVYLDGGQADQAERLWRRAARMHAENRACRQALAWLMLQQRKPLESILLLRELARLEPQNMAYPVEMARLYADLGRVSDGVLVLQEFVEAVPDSAAGQTALAEFFLRVKKEPGPAVRHAQKAAELSGLAADWALLSSAHERNGDIPAAIAALVRATDLAPDNPQYRQLLALLKERDPTATKQPSSGNAGLLRKSDQPSPGAAPLAPSGSRP